MITDNWRADAYEKLDYIHENPVKAGIVWEAEQCVYSSAINYTDGKEQAYIEVQHDADSVNQKK